MRALLRFSALLLVLAVAAPAFAADHLDAPALSGNGQVDINDLYAFQSPSNPANSVLIMTVNPFAGVLSPLAFDPAVEYQIQIDNTGDAVADITYTASFGAAAPNAVQSYTLSQDGTAIGGGLTGVDLPTTGGGTVRAGLFDDPFFFDLAGFQDGLNFTGDDAFAGQNVAAIVLEVPSTDLNGADSNIGVWARTVEGGVQQDRMGRPAINTVLIPAGRKDEFNGAAPAGDFAAFGDDVQAIIEVLNGGDSATAAGLTSVLLPDVLTFDTSSADGFLNGRRLADDVIDAELTLLTNSSTPIGDGVDANDQPFLDVFPYLAGPNVIPEPGTAALLLLASAGGLLGGRSRR